jgi:hypothetical protein
MKDSTSNDLTQQRLDSVKTKNSAEPNARRFFDVSFEVAPALYRARRG